MGHAILAKYTIPSDSSGPSVIDGTVTIPSITPQNYLVTQTSIIQLRKSAYNVTFTYGTRQISARPGGGNVLITSSGSTLYYRIYGALSSDGYTITMTFQCNGMWNSIWSTLSYSAFTN